MNTIKFPDGYNGDVVECDCEPIEKDGDLYKLQVHGSYLFRWCTKEQWENAMYTAYEEEMYEAYTQETERSIAKEYQRMEQQEKYQAWLREE